MERPGSEASSISKSTHTLQIHTQQLINNNHRHFGTTEIVLFKICLTITTLVALGRSMHITDCISRNLLCMSGTETAADRETCQQIYINCNACTAMEMTCRAAAINDTAADTRCTVESQHCYNQELCWGTLEGGYACTDALQTCLGGTTTEHCAHQKEICDACAVQEHLCRTDPHYKNQGECSIHTRACYWDAISLNETLYKEYPCEIWKGECPGPLCPYVSENATDVFS